MTLTPSDDNVEKPAMIPSQYLKFSILISYILSA